MVVANDLWDEWCCCSVLTCTTCVSKYNESYGSILTRVGQNIEGLVPRSASSPSKGGVVGVSAGTVRQSIPRMDVSNTNAASFSIATAIKPCCCSGLLLISASSTSSLPVTISSSSSSSPLRLFSCPQRGCGVADGM